MSDFKARAEAEGPLAQKVYGFVQIMYGLVKEAKHAGFTSADWAPLAELIDTANFKRMGVMREAMSWRECAEFYTHWARASEWEPTFRRITEVKGRVYLELDEWARTDGQISEINSCSVYEFNSEGKLQKLDVYMQSPKW